MLIKGTTPFHIELSKRETEVMDELVKGKTNKEIGATLFIAMVTVKFHMYNIFQKTATKTRTEALVKYLAFKNAQKVVD